MPLYNEAYLEIDDGDGTIGTFEFRDGFEPTTDVNKSFLMGDAGQYIREIINQDLLNTGVDAGERRTGAWIDGGAGDWEIRFQYTTGMEGDSIQWGDGSGGTGPSNITRTDASGAEVKPLDRQQIAAYWVASTRTDSLIPAYLHWGQWTDGSVGGADAGAFDAPMPVAVKELTAEKSTDSPSAVTGTLTVSHLAVFPDEAVPDYVIDYFGSVEDSVGDIPDA